VSESVRKLIWRVILHGMLLYEILSKLRLGAIINTSSGGCDLESEQKMLNIFKAAGIVEPKMWCSGADQMGRAFAEAFGQKLEVLVVLGGDGTLICPLISEQMSDSEQALEAAVMPDEEVLDAIIVGGGPAGLNAALVLGRCLRRVLVCDAGHPPNEPARIFDGCSDPRSRAISAP